MDIHPISALKTGIKWIAQAWTEADNNGGKLSFSRILGTYVVIQIVQMSWRGNVPEPMMTMFWVLIGYPLVSKVLNSLSPAVLDIAKSWLVKAGVPIKTDTDK